jgi:hypothetical protein
VLVALWPSVSQRFSSPSSTAASSRRTRNSRAGKSSKALFYFAVQNPHPSPKAFPAFVTSMPVISPPKSSRPSALPSHTLHPTTLKRAPLHPSMRKAMVQTRKVLPSRLYMPDNRPVHQPINSRCPRSNLPRDHGIPPLSLSSGLLSMGPRFPTTCTTTRDPFLHCRFFLLTPCRRYGCIRGSGTICRVIYAMVRRGCCAPGVSLVGVQFAGAYDWLRTGSDNSVISIASPSWMTPWQL